ncbi:hypothetical protein [Anaeromassilibacillus sp. SJQ-5]
MMSVCGCEGGKTPAVSRPATYIEPDFVRQDPAVIEAKLVTVNGVPRMVIDGRQTEPIMMSAMYGYDNPEATLHEIKLAGENGTDIVRTVVNFDVSAPESSIPAAVDGMMKQVLEQNPDALIVMGFGVTAAAYRLPGGDAAFDHFRDQTGKQEMFCSLASEAWIDQACRASKALVEYVLSVPDYAGRVIGYQPCAGSAGEWFGPLFWEGSIDHSPANTAGFRASLKAKYGTDAALRDAWGDGNVSLDTAEIPDGIPGSGLSETRNPLNYTLILTPENQVYTDYEDYYSGMLASRIAALCGAIKEASGRRSLTMTYFGYHSEVRAPFSGSFGLYRLLESPDVDILAGPVSYADRNEGGIGAFMSPVSSIHAAGKMWIDEGDYRTPFQTSPGFAPGGTQTGVGDSMPFIQTAEQAYEVLKRQIGKGMVYGSGTWWLDLVYRGWFDDETFWKVNAEAQRAYAAYAAYQSGAGPEVAVVYDEQAMNMLGQPWQISEDLLVKTKDFLYRSGYSFGYYSSKDVAEGRADDAKIYYMLTPWRLDAQTAAALKEKLHGSKKTVVWLYGYGLTGQEEFASLTGFRLSENRTAGLCDIQFIADPPKGLETLKGQFFTNRDTKPWYAVEAGGKTALALYDGSDKVAAAINKDNGYTSIFYGNTGLNEKLYKTFNELAGAHCLLDSGDAIYADDALAVVHTGAAGTRTLRLPRKCDVYDYFGKTWTENVRELTFEAGRNQTFYFFYGDRKAFEACGIGAAD